MQNPLTGDDLPKRKAEHVEKLRQVRRGARKAARSGHPGKRAEALRVLAHVPAAIRQVYISEVGR